MCPKIGVKGVTMQIETVKKMNAPLYLQVWENKLRLTDMRTGRSVELNPVVALKQRGAGQKIVEIGGGAERYEGREGYELCRPFADPARFVANMEIAEKVVQYLFKELGARKIRKPLLIVHPMGQYKNWVSSMEQQFFTELGFSAGARDVVVYAGEEQKSFDFYALKGKQGVPASVWVQRLLFVALIAAAAAAVWYAYRYGE